MHILRTFVHHFMRGHALDIQDPTRPLERETAEIFISLLNLYEDGLDELLGSISHDPSRPLEVTFCDPRFGWPPKGVFRYNGARH